MSTVFDKPEKVMIHLIRININIRSIIEKCDKMFEYEKKSM